MDLRHALAARDDAVRQRGRGIAAETLAVFAFFALAHWQLYGGTGTWTDADAPYHHLLIAGIHAHGFWQDVTWLPYTVLGTAGPDHHWFWHLALAPFAAIDDLATRIDAVNAVSFALVPASANLALRLLGVRYAPLWVLFLMAGTDWALFRWSQARAQNPAIVLMLLFIVALARRHRGALLLIPFVAMNTYHGAALLAAPGALLFTLRAWRERHADWLLLVLPALGGAAALLTSPWFPQNIDYFLFHTIDKVGDALGIDVGREWQPVSPSILLGGLWLQLLVLTVVVAVAAPAWRRLQPLTLAVGGVVVFVIALTLQHARFIEYCPPVIILAAALVVRDCHERFRAALWFPVSAPAGALALLTFTLFLGAALHHRVNEANDLHRNENVGRLLSSYAAPGSLIANEKWADFPTLVWHAPGLHYLWGLDPYYLAVGDRDRFDALYRLRAGGAALARDPVFVRAAFGSDWFVSNDDAIIEYLVRSGQASVVLADRWNRVAYVGTDLQVRDRLLRDGTTGLTVINPPAPPLP